MPQPRPTSSSSAPASAARRSPPGLRGIGASILIARARRAARRHAADARHAAIFVDGHFRPKEIWLEAGGPALQSRQLLLCRRQFEVLRRGACSATASEDFARHGARWTAISPAWPFSYDEFEPWYCQGRAAVSRCAARWARIRRSRRTPGLILHRRCPTRRPSPRSRERLAAAGLHPFSLPLAVDIERWLARARTPLGRLSQHPHRQVRRRDGCARRGAAVSAISAW